MVNMFDRNIVASELELRSGDFVRFRKAMNSLIPRVKLKVYCTTKIALVLSNLWKLIYHKTKKKPNVFRTIVNYIILLANC